MIQSVRTSQTSADGEEQKGVPITVKGVVVGAGYVAKGSVTWSDLQRGDLLTTHSEPSKQLKALNHPCQYVIPSRKLEMIKQQRIITNLGCLLDSSHQQ